MAYVKERKEIKDEREGLHVKRNQRDLLTVINEHCQPCLKNYQQDGKIHDPKNNCRRGRKSYQKEAPHSNAMVIGQKPRTIS